MGMALNPSTAMFLSGAGLAGGAVGAYKSAKGQKAALAYQASVAENNTKLAQEQARFAELDGAQEEQSLRMKVASSLADQKAVAAANGVDVSMGSPVELMASTKYIGELDAMTIRDNTARRAWALRENARGFENEAAMDRATAGAMSPWMAAAGSILTNGGTVANRWYRWRESQYGKGG